MDAYADGDVQTVPYDIEIEAHPFPSALGSPELEDTCVTGTDHGSLANCSTLSDMTKRGWRLDLRSHV